MSHARTGIITVFPMIDQDTLLQDLGIPYLEMVLDEIFNLPPTWVDAAQPRPDTVGALAKATRLDPRGVVQKLEEIVAMMQDIEWSPVQLKQALDLQANTSESAPILVDVRQRWEYEVCHIPGSILLAESNFSELLPKLRQAARVVTICHHGVRSFSAAMYLRQHGVGSAVSLAGGVARWAEEIDPTMARY